MLNEIIKQHLLNTLREGIKGKQPAEARAVIAGEIYMRQQHLAEAQRMEERMNDEIAELRKFDVDAGLKKNIEG